MSRDKMRGFQEHATNVTIAYQETQRQYDDTPPRIDLIPIVNAINLWALICGCYMGIEQTLKLLIRMRINTLDAGSDERIDLEERFWGKETHGRDL